MLSYFKVPVPILGVVLSRLALLEDSNDLRLVLDINHEAVSWNQHAFSSDFRGGRWRWRSWTIKIRPIFIAYVRKRWGFGLNLTWLREGLTKSSDLKWKQWVISGDLTQILIASDIWFSFAWFCSVKWGRRRWWWTSGRFGGRFCNYVLLPFFHRFPPVFFHSQPLLFSERHFRKEILFNIY